MCAFDGVTRNQWDRYPAGCDSVEQAQWEEFLDEISPPCTCEELQRAVHDERFSGIRDDLWAEYYSRC